VKNRFQSLPFKCNLQRYTAGEDQAITWGQGAGNGELGYGLKGPKSSANPKLVDSLKEKMIHMVACGVGHTLFVIDPKHAEGLPTWEPPSDEGAADEAGGAKRKGRPAAADAKKPKKAPKKAPKKK
jgi:hypothetical protein